VQYATQDILALAHAAWRANGNNFISAGRWPQAGMDTPSDANSFLVRAWLDTDLMESFTIEADRQFALEAVQHARTYSFRALKGTVSEFELNVIRHVQEDRVDAKHVGMLCYMPELVRRNQVNDRLEQIGRRNPYDGSVKRVQGMFVSARTEYVPATRTRWGAQLAKWHMRGVLDIDGVEVAVHFYFKDRIEVDVPVPISGRTKSVDARGIGRLGYVKIVKAPTETA
jgi:hypothetical protein